MLGYITMCIRENTDCAAPDTSSVSPSRFWAALCQMVLNATDRVHSGYDVVRILVATVLLTAAALKGHQLATEPVLGSGLLDSRWFLIGVVEFELFFGLWLLVGLLPKLTWAAALMCFSLFTCVSLYKALSGHATCGCFGRVPVNPWYTTTLDLTIVLSLLRWRPRGLLFSFCDLTFARSTILLTIWLCVGLPAAFAIVSYAETMLSDTGKIIGDGDFIVLEPEKWIGKRFPLLDYINIGNKLKEGKWLVLLYHHDCPKCQEAISNLEHMTREGVLSGETMQTAVIELPPYDVEQLRWGSRGIPYLIGRLTEAKDWFVTTPQEVILDGAIVRKVGNRKI